jgi:hypothetical protein
MSVAEAMDTIQEFVCNTVYKKSAGTKIIIATDMK